MSENDLQDKVEIAFVKPDACPEILVSGAVGGVNPTARRIYMALYIERAALPKKSSLIVERDGRVTAENIEQPREIERMIGVVAHMDLIVAESLRQWLDHHIHALRSTETASSGKGN